uniref:Uncharacterized protein n=1 Tax=Rhizophora mucronata TaxID=61149 RepID=A0A2P2QGJ2_RHIMU
MNQFMLGEVNGLHAKGQIKGATRTISQA